MIPTDDSLTAIGPRGVAFPAATGVVSSAILHTESGAGSPHAAADNASGLAFGLDVVANGARDRRYEKGIVGSQFHRDHADDDVLVSPPRDPTALLISDTVSVPEPATLGLMGVGLLLVAFARRARGLFRRSASIA
jgi:hypothetical protein